MLQNLHAHALLAHALDDVRSQLHAFASHSSSLSGSGSASGSRARSASAHVRDVKTSFCGNDSIDLAPMVIELRAFAKAF